MLRLSRGICIFVIRLRLRAASPDSWLGAHPNKTWAPVKSPGGALPLGSGSTPLPVNRAPEGLSESIFIGGDDAACLGGVVSCSIGGNSPGRMVGGGHLGWIGYLTDIGVASWMERNRSWLVRGRWSS